MIIKSSTIKDLVAVGKHNRIVPILNKVLRKPISLKTQDRDLSDGSICIVCSYIFHDSVSMRWSDKVKAICHPFKNTSNFPFNIKQYLLSESDFCDDITIHNNGVVKNRYDFIYFTIDSDQGIACKGSYMLDIINKAAGQIGAKGLVVCYGGGQNFSKPLDEFEIEALKIRKLLPSLTNLTYTCKLYEQEELCKIMKSAKFILFPNNRDASPRMITEALVRGVPVLVNKNIYGGWKYVNEDTGMFFDAPSFEDYVANDWNKLSGRFVDEISQKMSDMIRHDFSKVSEKYYSEYGFLKSCKKLAGVINEINKTNYSYVAYSELTPILEEAMCG